MPKEISSEQFNDIVQAFEEAGFESRPYIGRAMFGITECLGVTCKNPTKTLLEAVSYVADRAEEADDVTTFIDRLGTPETDDMGMDKILYFPAVVYQYEEDEEDGNED